MLACSTMLLYSCVCNDTEGAGGRRRELVANARLVPMLLRASVRGDGAARVAAEEDITHGEEALGMDQAGEWLYWTFTAAAASDGGGGASPLRALYATAGGITAAETSGGDDKPAGRAEAAPAHVAAVSTEQVVLLHMLALSSDSGVSPTAMNDEGRLPTDASSASLLLSHCRRTGRLLPRPDAPPAASALTRRPAFSLPPRLVGSLAAARWKMPLWSGCGRRP